MEIKWKWRINKNNRENIQKQFFCFLSARTKLIAQHIASKLDLDSRKYENIDCIKIKIKFPTFLCGVKDIINPIMTEGHCIIEFDNKSLFKFYLQWNIFLTLPHLHLF